MRRYRLSATIAVAASLSQLGCGPDPLDHPRALYAENKLAEAYPLFAALAERRPRHAEAHAWLAETARRTRRYDEARDAALAAVALDSCSAFALTVLGSLFQPIYSDWGPADADSAWHYYRQAVACDPDDGNAWVGLWMEALRRGEAAWEHRALASLGTSGFLTPTVLAYNRWVLRSLPPDALLLTSGDWDTYPALALQAVGQVRTDVGVVNLSMLNLPWYVRLVSERYGLAVPLDDDALDRLQGSGRLADSVVRVWRAQSVARLLGRPLAQAATVGSAPDDAGVGMFQDAGPFRLLVTAAPAADTSALRRALADVASGDFAGPEVSPADRSAIRMSAAVRRPLTSHVLATAFGYSGVMRSVGDSVEATRALAWADSFAREVGLSEEWREMLRRSIVPAPSRPPPPVPSVPRRGGVQPRRPAR